MAKIIIDAREYSTSTGRYISKLIEYLQLVDTQNKYVVLLKATDMDSCPITNANFTKLECPYKEFSFAEQLGFTWQLYRLKPDLVHFCMTQQPLLYLKASITTVHDLTTARYNNPDKNPYIFFVKQQIYKLVIWFAAHKSKRVITPSLYVKKDLINYTKIKPAKVIVTYEAADRIKDRPVAIESLIGKQFLMYVGRSTPHKNLWRLIQAFDAMKGMYPDLYLVLAGKIDNNYSSLNRRTTSSGIMNVVFTDFISEGKLRWLYENTSAYVFPSVSEGFGLPGLEAMIHGAALVSSNATCLPEIYGPAAIYFDALDKSSLIKALSTVLGDQEFRQHLIKTGLEQAGTYSWQKMAEQTIDLYNTVLVNPEV